MSKNPFDLFISLITFDQTLHESEKEIVALETVIEGLEDQIDASKDLFEKEQAKLHGLKKEVDMQELEMKTVDEKGKAVQERFSAASNNKEYLALKTETEEIQKAQMEAEAYLITVWNNLENAQKSVVTKEKEYQEQKDTLTTQITEKQVKVDEIEVKFQAEQKGRAAKEEGIPEEWVEKYERMRNSVPDPVSAVEDKNCKACFYAMTNQEMELLKRKKLLQCKGCYRFLYINYTAESEDTNAG